MNQTVTNIQQWAHDRNLIEGSGLVQQFTKTMEEMAELVLAIELMDMALFIDAVGDILVTMIIAEMHGESKYMEEVPYGDPIPCKPWTPEKAWNRSEREMNRAMSWLGFMYSTIIQDNHNQGQVVYGLRKITESLASMASAHSLTLQECLDHAYGEIKDRKGTMVNGIFVKAA